MPARRIRLHLRPLIERRRAAIALKAELDTFLESMEMEITLPDEVAVMTLPNVTFFPQALLPLHIFEPRYRQMVTDTLASHRLFAVAGLRPQPPAPVKEFEPPHRIATIGIVRACQKNEDGTSNLLLQGLARVEFTRILREEPYRTVRIRALASQPGADPEENARLRKSLGKLIVAKQRLGAPVPREFAQFLKTIDDPETFVDLAAFSLCEDTGLKQKLLETLDVHRRLKLLSLRIQTEIDEMKLRLKLQGKLSDDDIAAN
jgi:Lon protease-like protein